MKRLLITITLALTLGGCALFRAYDNPVGPNQLAAVESAYGIALSVAVAYHDACGRKVIPSSCRPIVVRMQTVGAVAHRSVITARNFVRQNPTLDASSVVQAARVAVENLKAVQAQYGVQ